MLNKKTTKRPNMRTQTIKAALREAYDAPLCPERLSALGYHAYMQAFHKLSLDFGRGAGHTTAAIEFVRDNTQALMVVKSDTLANDLKRQYRTGNVMSLRQYMDGHSARQVPLKMVIFDECKTDHQPFGVRTARLGGAV